MKGIIAGGTSQGLSVLNVCLLISNEAQAELGQKNGMLLSNTEMLF